MRWDKVNMNNVFNGCNCCTLCIKWLILWGFILSMRNNDMGLSWSADSIHFRVWSASSERRGEMQRVTPLMQADILLNTRIFPPITCRPCKQLLDRGVLWSRNARCCFQRPFATDRVLYEKITRSLFWKQVWMGKVIINFHRIKQHLLIIINAHVSM